MSSSTVEYLPILLVFCFSCLLSAVVLILAFLCAPSNLATSGSDKLSAYECGFDPFDDARSRFDIRFYLVAILFMIFDLEVTFLFPWALVLAEIGVFGFWTMFVFLLLLTLGFIYEWRKGGLDC